MLTVRVLPQKSLAPKTPESTCRSRYVLIFIWLLLFQLRDYLLHLVPSPSPCLFLLPSTRMHAFHGPNKKTSINSLLNPEDSSVFPVPPTHAGVNASQSHSHVRRDTPQYSHTYPASDGAYNLRTATWDTNHSDEPSHGRHGRYDHRDAQPRVATPHMSTSFSDHHYHAPRSSERQESRIATDLCWPEQSSSCSRPFPDERNGKRCARNETIY